MRSSRRLPDDARAAIAGFVDIKGFGDAWALIQGAFPETELRECERLIGLDSPDPEFRKGITDALFFSACIRGAGPKRASTVRRELRLVEKRATAAATSLQQLTAAMDQTIFYDLLPEVQWMAPPVLAFLRRIAEVARQAADRLKDRGGPSKMAAFDAFIRLLADAFSRAIGHPAGITWSEYHNRYEGRFYELIDRVLSRAEILAGDGFAPASNLARGRQVQRILTTMDKTPTVTP